MSVLSLFNLIEFTIFLLIILNSILITLNINYTLKFSTSELVFCPAFGSVNRCDFISMLSFVCIFSCFVFIVELIQICENTKTTLILKKNKLFMIKIYTLFWLVSIILIFIWSNQVEADLIEKIKNICRSFLNLFLFVSILLVCIKKKKIEILQI
nr:hypothetical protein CcurKRNrm1_p065 [Cryptomonas curvata]